MVIIFQSEFNDLAKNKEAAHLNAPQD